MPKTHSVTQTYGVSAETLWQDLLDPHALAESMKGSITYIGLPTNPVEEGQQFTVKIKRWGWLPMGQWTMKVVKRDDQNYVLQSEEWGGPVKLYKHSLTVEPLGPSSCRYTDDLELDSGWLTSLMFPTFKKMYARRHVLRKARLEGVTAT